MASPRWSRVIVTGAASGIGRCFAETLAAAGGRLGLLDLSADGVAAVAAALGAAGAVHTRVADVAGTADAAAAVGELVAALGGLDLLIHCAAVLGGGGFADRGPAAFERVVRVNLVGTANVLHAALPALRQTRGAAVCLASTAALHGWPQLSAYSAAKFGVAGFCDGVRGELARDGVSLTAVFPLLIDTPLLAGSDLPPILRRGRRLPPAAVVGRTLAAVERRRARVFIPGGVRLIAALHGLAPSLLDWYGRRAGLT